MTILDVDGNKNIFQTTQLNFFTLDDSEQRFEVVRIMVSHVLQLSEEKSVEGKGRRWIRMVDEADESIHYFVV